MCIQHEFKNEKALSVYEELIQCYDGANKQFLVETQSKPTAALSLKFHLEIMGDSYESL